MPAALRRRYNLRQKFSQVYIFLSLPPEIKARHTCASFCTDIASREREREARITTAGQAPEVPFCNFPRAEFPAFFLPLHRRIFSRQKKYKRKRIKREREKTWRRAPRARERKQRRRPEKSAARAACFPPPRHIYPRL